MESFEEMYINIPEDAKMVAGDEDYDTVRDFVKAIRRYDRCVGTEIDGPETLQLPCDALSDGNPHGYTTFVTHTYEDPSHHYEGQVQVIFVFTDEEIEGKEPEAWPWDTAHVEVVPTEEIYPAWSIFDMAGDCPYEPTFRTAQAAIDRAEDRWNTLHDETERRACVRSREHRFLVLDPQGYELRDFGVELARAIDRREFAEDTEEHLGNIIATMSNIHGHEWVDSAYALADAWDGTEEVGELMHEYGMDADDALDMLDVLMAIHVIAQRREE